MTDENYSESCLSHFKKNKKKILKKTLKNEQGLRNWNIKGLSII